MKKVLLIGVCLLFTFTFAGAAAAITIDFEGLQDNETILSFYNGGTGGNGSGPGANYGVVFQDTARGLIDEDAGGSGNFGAEPSPDTGMYMPSDLSAYMNVLGGFIGTLDFYYTSPLYEGNVSIYDGLNGTGNLLATLDLGLTTFNGAPDPQGPFSPFEFVTLGFQGTAMSAVFSSDAANQIVIDDISFNQNTGVVPEPATMLLVGFGMIGLAGVTRKKIA